MEGFPVRKLSALWYFPVPQTRWNTLVSAILTLNPKENESRPWWNDRESQWGTLGFWELGSLFWKPRSKTGGASADASGNGKLLFWPQQMQNKACIAELGAHCWFDIERNVDNLYSWLINYLFFGLDFFPELPFTFSWNTFQLTTSRLAATSRSAWSFSTEPHFWWPRFWVGTKSRS